VTASSSCMTNEQMCSRTLIQKSMYFSRLGNGIADFNKFIPKNFLSPCCLGADV